MNTLDFKTFQARVALLNEISGNSESEILMKIREEEAKLINDKEQILLAHNSQSPHPNKETVLYRTTSVYPSFDEKIVSCFSHPKPNSTQLNRCNLPKYPVFYCSDSGSICINEALYNKTLSFPFYLYLSHWRVDIDRKWKILPFVFQALPSMNKAHDYAEKNRQMLFDKYKGFLREDEIEQYIHFYHQEFRKESDYKFSSLVSYKFLYEDDGDIVLYSSVQLAAEGNNYAINIKHIDDKSVLLIKVDKIRIDDAGGTRNWYLEAEGTPKDDFVEWQKL